jgi:glutathione S-transferase
MKLYGVHLSPFVMRPLLIARAKGHDLPLDMPEGGIKGDDFIAMSPIAKMPLLHDGGFHLPESQVIAEYLEATLSGPKTISEDPKVAARERLLVRLADVYIVPELGGLFNAREKPEGLAPALEKIGTAMGYIEHFRNAGDTFAIGDRFSIADAALIPLFFFFDAFGAGMPTAELIAARPGIAAWWARAKVSELGSRAITEQAAGLKAMIAQRAAAA